MRKKAERGKKERDEGGEREGGEREERVKGGRGGREGGEGGERETAHFSELLYSRELLLKLLALHFTAFSGFTSLRMAFP